MQTLSSVRQIDFIVINTDAENLILKNGFSPNEKTIVRERKKEICGDFVSMNKIIEDDINAVKSDVYIMTHTTNPLISVKTIQDALSAFIENWKAGKCDSLFTVNKVQTRFYTKDCKPVNHNPACLIRTQDVEPWFEENSNLYIFTKESFLSTQSRIGKMPMLFETPRHESIDIDDQWSWDLAENFAKTNELSHKAQTSSAER